MYDHQGVARCRNNDGACPRSIRPTRLLKGSFPFDLGGSWRWNDTSMYVRPRTRQTTRTKENKTNHLIVYWFVSFVGNTRSMYQNQYICSPSTHWRQPRVRCFFFLGSLCADHVSNLVYGTCTLSSGLPNVWHCSRTLYLISISHENRNVQFRKDGRYTVSFSSRPCCQAPHNGRNSFFSRLSGAVRKLPRLENTGTVRDDKTSPGRCYFFVVVMLTVF